MEAIPASKENAPTWKVRVAGVLSWVPNCVVICTKYVTPSFRSCNSKKFWSPGILLVSSERSETRCKGSKINLWVIWEALVRTPTPSLRVSRTKTLFFNTGSHAHLQMFHIIFFWILLYCYHIFIFIFWFLLLFVLITRHPHMWDARLYKSSKKVSGVCVCVPEELLLFPTIFTLDFQFILLSLHPIVHQTSGHFLPHS